MFASGPATRQTRAVYIPGTDLGLQFSTKLVYYSDLKYSPRLEPNVNIKRGLYYRRAHKRNGTPLPIFETQKGRISYIQTKFKSFVTNVIAFRSFAQKPTPGLIEWCTIFNVKPRTSPSTPGKFLGMKM